jgi:drug/metabolite transporter (DMT)-like permease
VGCVASSLVVASVWQAPTAAEWIYLPAIGVIAAVAHLFLIKAFERADASTLAPFTYSEVIGGAVLGFIVFGDVPDPWGWTGLAIIVLSAIAVVSRKRQAKPAAA